jgi:hypothetical protein
MAHDKGVNARVATIEGIGTFAVAFDIVFSNFGGLNCIRDVSILRDTLARLIRPRGVLAVCVMSRFCLWESAYFAVKGSFKQAARRWGGNTVTSAGLRLFYPSSRQLQRALSPGFELETDIGVGITVPPSFVRSASSAMLRRMASVDAHIEASRIGRMIGDHRLLAFRRS